MVIDINQFLLFRFLQNDIANFILSSFSISENFINLPILYNATLQGIHIALMK